MNISGMDKSRLKILAACEEFSTTEEISERVGIHRATVSQYLSTLGDYVIREVGTRPWKYKRNPDKTFVPSKPLTREEVWRKMLEEKANQEYPLLPQGPLSFLKPYEYYKPPVGREIEEKHAGWINRKEGSHIGCGSCAHLEMYGG
jgi:hypothetical protein